MIKMTVELDERVRARLAKRVPWGHNKVLYCKLFAALADWLDNSPEEYGRVLTGKATIKIGVEDNAIRRED